MWISVFISSFEPLLSKYAPRAFAIRPINATHITIKPFIFSGFINLKYASLKKE